MRAAVVVIVLGLVACTKPNPNRCCTDQADCDAHAIPVGTSCAQGLVCRGNQCIAEVCMTSTDCDLSAPFCVDSSCAAACTADGQCPGNAGDPTKVYCEGGACVACRAGGSDCPMTAPVCDMGTCRACAGDSDCSSAVCDRDSGACVDQTQLLYASATGGATSACTMTDPCTIDHAFAIADASRPNIKLLPGMYPNLMSFHGTFTLSVYGPANAYGFYTQQNGGGMRLRNLDLVTANCSAFANNAALPSLDVEDVTFTSDLSSYPPLGGGDCHITARRVTVTVTTVGTGAPLQFTGFAGSGGALVTLDQFRLIGGDPGIMMSDASTLTVTNSVFENQGTTSGAILFVNNSPSIAGTVSFSTFHNSTLKCPAASAQIAFSSTIFFNEATGAPANTVTGTACTHSYDLIKPQATSPGSSNVLNVDPHFVNATTGDLHLMMGSPAIDAADPTATLTSDFDGTTRPQGAARDIGAFEYKP